MFLLTAHDDISKNGGGEIRTDYVIKQAQAGSNNGSVSVFKPSLFFNSKVIKEHFGIVKLVIPFVYFLAALKNITVRDKRIDLIYCGTCYPNDSLGAIMLKFIFGIPTACVSHDTPAQLVGYKFYRNSEKLGILKSVVMTVLGRIEELFIRAIDFPISISSFGKDYLEKIVKGKVLLDSSNGVREVCSTTDLTLEARIYDIVYVGRIIPRKNIHMLLDAIDRLDSDGVRLNMLVITNTPDAEMQDIFKFMTHHSTNTRFTLAKNVSEEEKFKLLRKAKISVNVSYDENFSISVLESASCGNALILTDILSFKNIYGKSAYYVEMNDVISLADTIKTLLGEPQKLTECMKSAREVASKYNYQSIWNRELTYFSELLHK